MMQFMRYMSSNMSDRKRSGQIKSSPLAEENEMRTHDYQLPGNKKSLEVISFIVEAQFFRMAAEVHSAVHFYILFDLLSWVLPSSSEDKVALTCGI